MPYNAFGGADVDIIDVAEGWIQDNQDLYAWPRICRTAVRSEHNGGSGTTNYKLPDIKRFLLDGTGGVDQPLTKPGPAGEKLDEVDVALVCRPKGNPRSMGRPTKADKPRDKALDKLIPGQLAITYQMIENALAQRLVSSTHYTAVTWAAVLDTGNAEPLRELTLKLLPFRKYQHGGLWKLCGIIDERVLTVLQTYVDFHGGGTGSARVAYAKREDVVEVLKVYLGLDELLVIKGAHNTAVKGQTGVVSDLGAGLFWIGLVDQSTGYDLTTYMDNGPDGGLVLAFGQEPYVKTWMPSNGESVEMFQGRAEFGFNTPRTTDGPSAGKWGMYFTSAQNLS